MRKVHFVLFVLLVVGSAFIQPKESCPIYPSVSATKMNVLYAGIPNPVAVSVPGFRPDKVKIESMDASITAGNVFGSFQVTPNADASKVDLAMQLDISNDEGVNHWKKLTTTSYKVRLIPTPILLFAGASSGQGAEKNAARQAQRVMAGFDSGFPFDHLGCEIEGFTLLITPADVSRKPYRATTEGDLFTEGMKKALAQVQPGDVIAFLDVKTFIPSLRKDTPFMPKGAMGQDSPSDSPEIKEREALTSWTCGGVFTVK